MTKIDDFKAFVKTKPSLVGYVRDGSMTWQSFYELWDLYGPDHSEWNKYNVVKPENRTTSTVKQEAFGLNEIINMVRKLDMATVQKNLTGLQKAIGLVQDMTGKGSGVGATAKEAYTPRPLYRKFED